MNDEVLELVIQQLTEIRLNDIIQKNAKYRQAVQAEIELYERFIENLSDWQREEFEKYWIASSESELIREKLSYKQGMKDLMALLRSLGSDGD